MTALASFVRLAGTLDPRGPGARQIDGLWQFMLVLGGVVFVLVTLLLAMGLFRRGRDDPSPPPSHSGRGWLLGSVALSTGGVLAVLVATLGVMRDSPAASRDDLTVDVIGHQWWWEIEYPDHDVVTANEIHVPAGRQTLFRLRSADVIHSFWIPELGGKKDLLPEDTTTLVLEADEPGTYRGQCAEFCGLQHAKMGVYVLASPLDEFDEWAVHHSRPAVEPDTPLERRGAEVFLEADCAGCHTIRGTEADGDRGPDLTHLADRRTLAAGTLRNTTEDLIAWVTDPHAYKDGVLMEPAELEDDDLDALVAYLGSLK